MELAPPRRHWKRELLVTFAVVTVLVILYANPHELRNTIGGTGLYPGRRGSRGKDGASNNSSGGNGSPFPIRALGRFRHESNGTSGTDWESEEVVRVLLIFTRARELRYLREKLSICLGSLIELSSVPLRLYVVTDGQSADVALQVLADASAKASADVSAELLHEKDVLAPMQDLVSLLQPLFSQKGAYYNKKLFYLSMGLYRLFPPGSSVRQLILLDVDIQLCSDVALLRSHFSLFPSSAIMGLAYEQQPVYRHVLHKYRQAHPGTRCGDPAPRGHPGFNSGVALLDLEAMRNSTLYQRSLSAKRVGELVAKYSFVGHLGDQDFYSLLGWEHPELVYVLPCSWNRQLCEWWRHVGYEDVFEEYHRCEGAVHVYHGNCNSSIPPVR